MSATAVKDMQSCWKRAQHFAGWGRVPDSHPLAAAYRNYMWLADTRHDDQSDVDWQATAMFLHRFAMALNEHAKTHMLEGDLAVAKMLQSWQRRCFFDPTKLGAA